MWVTKKVFQNSFRDEFDLEEVSFVNNNWSVYAAVSSFYLLTVRLI